MNEKPRIHSFNPEAFEEAVTELEDTNKRVRLSYLDREPRPWTWATTLVLITVGSAAFGFIMGLFIGAVILGGF